MSIRRISFTPDATLRALEAGHRSETATLIGAVVPHENGNLFSLGADAETWTHILLLLREDSKTTLGTQYFSGALYESIFKIIEELGGGPPPDLE